MLLILIPYLIFIAVVGVAEVASYRQAARVVRTESRAIANSYSETIAQRMFTHLDELAYIAGNLAQYGVVSGTLKTGSANGINNLIADHNDLAAVNVVNASSTTIVWSTTSQPTNHPIETLNEFVSWFDNPNMLVGKPTFATRFNSYIIATRFRATSDHTVLFYIASPYYLKDLLASTLVSDRRDITVNFGSGTNLHALVSHTSINYKPRFKYALTGALGVPLSYTTAIPGSTWSVDIYWPSSVVTNEWISQGFLRWALEALGLLMIIAATSIIYFGFKAERRRTALRQLHSEIDRLGLSEQPSLSAFYAAVGSLIGALPGIDSVAFATRRSNDSVNYLGNPSAQSPYEVLESSTKPALLIDSGDTAPTCSSDSLDELLVSAQFVASNGSTKPVNIAGDNQGWSILSIATLSDIELYLLICQQSTKRRWHWKFDQLRDIANEVSATVSLVSTRLRNRRLESLYRAIMGEGEVVLEAQSSHEMLVSTCARLIDQTSFNATCIGNFDSRGLLHIVAAAGEGIENLRQLQFTLTGPNAGSLMARAWNSRQVIFNNDHLSDPQVASWVEFLSNNHWHAAAALPIFTNSDLLAVLVVVSPEKDIFDPETLALCQRVVSLLGKGLEEFDLKTQLDQVIARESTLARRDPLTGLANRLAFSERLAEAQARSDRSNQALAVGVLDLDNFKQVNDKYGHIAGDELLKIFGTRLRKAMRSTDLVARLGGDEFVVLVEAIHSPDELSVALSRLEVVIKEPFELKTFGEISLNMSLGIALYPDDGAETDLLLRRADTALYEAKAIKSSRATWWLRWGLSSETSREQPTSPVDTYSERANALFNGFREPLLQAITRVTPNFYEQLAQTPEHAKILEHLNHDEIQALMHAQEIHMVELFDPNASQSSVASSGQKIGAVHALVGLSPSQINMASALFYNLLELELRNNYQSRTELRLILALISVRLQDDTAAQLHGHEKVLSGLTNTIHNPLPIAGATWAASAATEVSHIMRLAGILGATILSPDASGAISVVAIDGTSTNMAEEFSRPYAARITLKETSFESTAEPISRAWRTGHVVTLATVSDSDSLGVLAGMAPDNSIRSLAAIPIVDQKLRPVAILTLLGSRPKMFETAWGMQLCSNLGQRLGLVHQQSRWASAPVPLTQQALWRTQLFSGGLEMHYQPIISLRTGQVTGVEALARLRLDDGTLVAPLEFLPILNDAEVDRLLRLGTEQAIKTVISLPAGNSDLDVSVNLQPGSLVEPSFVTWLESTLFSFGLAPNRLALELLETDEFVDSIKRDTALLALNQIGVRLVMDDYGTGYSNVLRLRDLHFDGFKVDQGLVRNAAFDPVKVVELVGITVVMGRDLGLQVVVEGLEDDALVELAQMLGADKGQGFAIARPMPAEELQAWLQSYRPQRLRGKISSPLGALGFHWRFMHTATVTIDAPADDCKFHTFVTHAQLTGSKIDDLHRKIHSTLKGDRREELHSISNQLIAELSRLIVLSNATAVRKKTLHGR